MNGAPAQQGGRLVAALFFLRGRTLFIERESITHLAVFTAH